MAIPSPGRRLNITRAVRLVVRDVAKKLPEFGHVKASQVLVVAGEARRASFATIRPLASRSGTYRSGAGRPRVRVGGRPILYSITLRPLFFRGATFQDRVRTIVHEMFHISKRFDGSLHAGRRHDRLGDRFDRRIRPYVERYLALIPGDLKEALSANGLVSARQWLERPGPGGRKLYTEKQLFVGPVRMATPGPRNRRARRALH